MRTKGLIAIVVAVAIAGAYLAGYLSERTTRVAAEEAAATFQSKLAAAEARVRTGELLGQALTLKEVTMRQNYGQALDLSPAFFEAVRAEEAKSPEKGLRDGLNEILAKRDAVTAALATADPAVLETLRSIELGLRRALGYPPPPEPAAARPS